MISLIRKRKKLFNIILLCVVIGILSGSYFFLKDCFSDTEPEDEETPVIPLVNLNEDNVVNIRLESDKGNITFSREDDSWVTTEPYEVKLLQSKVNEYSETISSLEALKIAAENPDDLEPFGLKKPAVKSTAKLKDDTTVTVLVGNMVATGDSYYLMKEGDNAVYTIGKSTGQILTRELSDFRDRSIPKIEFEQDLMLFSMFGKDMRDIEIRRKADPDPDLVEFDMGLLEMTKPYYSPMGVDMTAFGPILNSIPLLSIEDFVEDFPEDLSKYGLDDPSGGIIMKDSENTVELILGDKTDDGKRYFQVKGSDAVYTILDSKLDFMDTKPFDLVTKFALIVNIDDVDKIIVEGRGEVHTLTMEREILPPDDTDPEAEEEELVTYKVDDRIVTEDAFKRFYQFLVGLSVDSELASEPEGDPDVAVTFFFNKGNIDSIRMEYVSHDRDFYSIVRDGKSDFIIAKRNVEGMLDELDILLGSNKE